MPRDIVPSRDGPRREISTEAHRSEGGKAWGRHKQERFNAAIEASKRPVEDGHRRMFDKARDHLRKLTPANAVRDMLALPSGLLELYLIVEEADQARPAVLQAFPKPGARARERYAPLVEEMTAAVGA